MKSYIVFLFQLMVWSGYTVAEWLSRHDRLIFKILMFCIFTYLAVYIGKAVLKSVRRTFFITVVSLTSYGVIQLILQSLIY
ncbi:hypothetical protein [Peribacillus sp. SCS-155]|uniref:hypothetical protein n=1 Tax=Peribacillus sedimenti TaxID=3115297 RepID=UPI003906D443